MTPLWKADHPYYMNEGCWCASGHHNEYESWSDFLENWGGLDEDMNLVFRWDWREGEDWGVPDGEAQLCIFYIMQRKAYTVSCFVKVTRDQEPEIREWLTPKAGHITKLWEPLISATTN